jgi:hypothetical protein
MNKKTTFTLRLIALLAIIVLFGSVAVKAQVPPPPVPQNVKLEIVEVKEGQTVQISWTLDTLFNIPVSFHIYMANKFTDDYKEFHLIAAIQPGKDGYKFIVPPPLANGEYSFYLTSVIIDRNTPVESDPSAIVQIKFEQKPYIKISKEYPQKAYLGKEYVYQPQAYSNVKCPIHFALSGNVPGNLKFDPKTGKISWIPLDTIPAQFTICAILDCDSTLYDCLDMKIMVLGHDNNQNWIKFVTEPPTHIKFGEIYKYQAQAKTNMPCEIIYKLAAGPDGMTIDEKTGLIIWTPKQPGTYRVAIQAILLNCNTDLHAVQEFAIVVDGMPNVCGIFAGKVIDEEGKPITSGLVYAYPAEKNDSLNWFAPFSCKINQEGFFSIMVPEGIYFLRVEGQGFYPEFFEDAKEMKDAKKMEIKCHDTVFVHFKVERIPEPKRYKVTGKVVDADNGNPVYAMVEFIPLEKNGNRDEKINVYFATKTDDKGNYTIELPDNLTFIARATSMMNSIWYLSQYYDKVENSMEADLIVVEGDLSGIDFYLKKVHQYENGFGGQVRADDSVNTPLRAVVTAYLVKPYYNNPVDKRYSRSVETDQLGNYMFKNLIPGEYVLLSIPIERKYVPGYYKMADIATLKWRDATRIGVDSVMIQISFDITHRLRLGYHGIAIAKGNVFERNSGIIKNTDKILSNDSPLPGAFVFAIDENNDVSDFGFTNQDGQYSLGELAIGSFRLLVDMPGFDSYETTINMDYKDNYNKSLSDIYLASEVLEVGDPASINADFNVYPQPVSNYAVVNFNGKQGNTVITILNSLGMELMITTLETVDGHNTYNLNVSELASGAYFLRIQSGNAVRTLPIRVIH